MPSVRHPVQRPSGSLAVVAALVAIGLAFACRREEPVPPGDIAGSLAVARVGGIAFDPGTLRGKPSVVMFGSPTCPHCLAELPVAQRAARAAGANLVAVFVVGTPDRAAGVAARAGFVAPVLTDDGSLRKRYAIESVPYTLILGADGHAQRAFHGEQTESTLRAALADVR